MSDKPFDAPNRKPGPPRRLKPGRLLFEFVRASDQARIACALRNHGQVFGWEAQFLERGELFYSRGRFVTRAAAVRWAEDERKAIERRG